MSHHTILVSFALICAIGYASGTTCYECSSVYDSGCSNDRFSRLGKSTASDCNYCQKSYTGAYGVSVTTRSCAAFCSEHDTSVVGATVTVSCCTGLLCNSATYFRASYVLLPVAALLTISTFWIR